MWIVELALRRPYTFIVVALAILIIGPLSLLGSLWDNRSTAMNLSSQGAAPRS